MFHDVKPQLETIIQSTSLDPLSESVKINFKRFTEDSKDYFEWVEALESRFTNLSFEYGNRGSEEIEINGVKVKCFCSYLRITNNTKRKEEARNFPCKFFGGDNKTNNFNSSLKTINFYSVLATAGLSKEDFEGKHDFLDRVYVKEISLQNLVLEECVIEMKTTLISHLEKATQRYVLIVLSLNEPVAFSFGDLVNRFDSRSLYMKAVPLREIIAYEENRIYFLFDNDKRSMLDLHLLSSEEAERKVLQFIKETHT